MLDIRCLNYVKAFIKSILNEIIIVITCILLFLLIFFLFNLPLSAFLLGAGIMLFIMIIYWLVQLSGFKEQVQMADTIHELEHELQQVKVIRLNIKLMWRITS